MQATDATVVGGGAMQRFTKRRLQQHRSWESEALSAQQKGNCCSAEAEDSEAGRGKTVAWRGLSSCVQEGLQRAA